MPQRPCLTCGALSAGSYCPRHAPKRGLNPKRINGWRATRWRQKALARTGGRCAIRGCRTPYDRVSAHHIVALADGGSPEGPGVALCHEHHRQATAAQQRARQSSQ